MSENKHKQIRIALRNCGIIDPENIEDALIHDAYMALGTVLSEKTPGEVIEIIKNSGLRGRGGAGHPDDRLPGTQQWPAPARPLRQFYIREEIR